MIEKSKKIVRQTFPRLFRLAAGLNSYFRSRKAMAQRKALPGILTKYYGQSASHAEIIDYVQTGRIEMIPYFYTDFYRSMRIEVHVDSEDNLPYALVKGRKIFFPKEMSHDEISESVRVGLMEQDLRSPHRYLPTPEIQIGGHSAVLCGASDGMYTLDIVDHFEKLYLFEANPAWLAPIRKTLKQYLHKVEVVPMYISDKDTETSVTLDTFFKTKQGELNYIQADIEGSELSMLKGAKGLLQTTGNIKMSLCCYHSRTQQKDISDFLSSYGFRITPAPGFLLMWMEVPLRAPYLRPGVLYVSK